MNIDYKFADNGWTVLVNEDVTKLTVNQAHDIARLAVSNIVVKFETQNITPDEQVEFCSKIGTCQKIVRSSKPSEQAKKRIAYNDYIVRVTGEMNKDGLPGMFGHTETLDWHIDRADQATDKYHPPLACLYGKGGTTGSVTSWLNMIKAYNDLSPEFKERIHNKKVICGYKVGRLSPDPIFTDTIKKDNFFDLVIKNKSNQYGLYFPFLQIFGMKDTTDNEYEDLYSELKEHVLQEKYMFHHYWKDNDLVIGEQWLGLHKRWAFDNMEKRVIHRIAFGYDKVFN